MTFHNSFLDSSSDLLAGTAKFLSGKTSAFMTGQVQMRIAA